MKRDKLFYKMCDILGDNGRRLLLTNYNEIFRLYHGIIGFHIYRFFDMVIMELVPQEAWQQVYECKGYRYCQKSCYR